jgi:hypothetical protein
MVLPIAACLLVAAMAVAGCGSKESGSSGIAELLKSSEEAAKSITSLSQQIDIKYQIDPNTEGTVTSRLIEVSGNNVHVKETFLTQTLAERVLVNGEQYSWTFQTQKWQKDPQVTLSAGTAATSESTSQYVNLASNSQKQEELGDENVNGYNCTHLRFTLSADNVRSMASQVPADQLASNTGGTIDLWIAKDTKWMIKSVGVFNDVTTPVGVVKLTVVIDRKSINQPITIQKPTL